MKIFISFSHQDKDYARKLSEALQSTGFDVWFDDLIEFGEEWENTIARKLEESDAVIVIMTESAASSQTMRVVYERAMKLKKKIFPLLLEDYRPPFSLQTISYVDVRGGRLPPDDFYQVLARLAGDTTTDAPPPESKKKKKRKGQ